MAITLPSAAAIPSRTTGAAPLCVFFDLSATTADTTTAPFHDLFYYGDFGDTNAGTWDNGADTTDSKNSFTGPVASHCYETAGTYTWQAFVSDETTTESISGTITVTSADDTFAATTACVANGTTPVAGEGGCPVGANVVDSADFDATLTTLLGAGVRRILLKRGDTFTSDAAFDINQSTGLLGAYGSGAKPIITTATTPLSVIKFSGVSKSDWRIMDLDIRNTNAASAVRGFDFTARFDQVTILRVDMTDLFRGVYADQGVMGGLEHELYLVDSTFSRTLFGSGISSGGYPVYVEAQQLGVMGNDFNGGGFGEHVMRYMQIVKGVISNNDISSPAPTKEALTIRAIVAKNTQYAIVSDNKITGGSYNDAVNFNPIVMTLKPQADANDERIIDTIIERNWLVFVGGTTVGNQIGLSAVPYSSMTIRNNLINTTGGKAHGGIEITTTTAVPAPDKVWVYNNTVYSGDTDNDFLIADFAVAVTNAVAKNNLAYAPNDSQHRGISCAGSSSLAACTSLTVSNNSLTTTSGGNGVLVDPLFDGPLTSPVGFRIGVLSYATNGGASIYPGTRADFFNGHDSLDNARIGAFVPAANFASSITVEEAASSQVIPGGVKRKRKLRIYPDGRRAFATEQEAVDALFLYYHEQKLKPKESEVLGLKPNRTKKVIVLPSEKAEIKEALEMASQWNTRRQEEEWLILYH